MQLQADSVKEQLLMAVENNLICSTRGFQKLFERCISLVTFDRVVIDCDWLQTRSDAIGSSSIRYFLDAF